MHGYDAHVTSQEHSAVPGLWRRSDPGIVIALNADLESIRLRRGNPRWSRKVWEDQQARLRDAFEHADFLADTSTRSTNDVVGEVLAFLHSRSHDGRGR
jgi:hypothetical protein